MNWSVKVISVFILCLSGIHAEAITQEKEDSIRELFVLMGISSMGEEMASSLVSISIAQEKARYPNLPKDVEYALSRAIYDVVIEYVHELDALMIPLYDKYYTQKEIQDLIAFFKTPAGVKYASVTAPMAQDIAQATQSWSVKIAPIAARRARKELEKHGYK